MADITNLTNFLGDIANAIRTKKETTGQIPAKNFDQEILSIETGSQINNQDKEITVNGIYTADEGYTGLGTVTVNVPQEDLQEQLNNQDLIIQQLQEELSNKAIYDCNYYNARLVPTNGKITSYITEISAQLDTSSVTDMAYMFDGCKNLTTIPELNTSSVTDMAYMFENCTNLTTIPLLNTSSVTDMAYMFDGCTNLTTIPLLDTSSVTNVAYMFRGCTNLTTIPQLDTSKVTQMQNMFNGCTNLTTIPQLDTSKVITMAGMFVNCTNLTTMPLLDTSNVTNMHAMFWSCANLTTIPLLNTSKVTDMAAMFDVCTNLTTIPQLDTSKVTNMTSMFRSCTSLSDESLNNILAMCKNATSYTSTKTLKFIGLTSEQANKCKTLSNYSAFTAAGWKTGY